MMSTTPGETHKYTNTHLVLSGHCEERWEKNVGTHDNILYHVISDSFQVSKPH